MNRIELILEERNVAVQKAKNDLEELARELLTRLPEDLRMFADEMSWLPTKIVLQLNSWKLPGFLEEIANADQKYGARDKIHPEDLSSFGFKSFADAERKLKQLEAAWSDLIRVRFEHEPGRLTVRYTLVKS